MRAQARARRTFQQAVTLLLAVTMLGAGCTSRPPPAPANRDRGREALRQALDAWQKGDSNESLHARQPPIYMNDTDWRAGSRLLSYELDGSDNYHGAQLRAEVKLALQDKSGNRTEKKVSYLIDTDPALVIVRGDY
jgi:hypothetical protein